MAICNLKLYMLLAMQNYPFVIVIFNIYCYFKLKKKKRRKSRYPNFIENNHFQR